MTKYKFVVLLGVLGILLFLVVLFAPLGRVYTLTLPEAENLSSIVLTQGTESVLAGNWESLLDTLTGIEHQTTREESIQDFPVNAENVIQIGFLFKEKGASTAFAYEKRGGYYLEQPYNGVFRLSEEEFHMIEQVFQGA